MALEAAGKAAEAAGKAAEAVEALVARGPDEDDFPAEPAQLDLGSRKKIGHEEGAETNARRWGKSSGRGPWERPTERSDRSPVLIGRVQQSAPKGPMERPDRSPVLIGRVRRSDRIGPRY